MNMEERNNLALQASGAEDIECYDGDSAIILSDGAEENLCGRMIDSKLSCFKY